MDLAPTFIEVAGASYPDIFQGREVVPVQGESLVALLGGMSKAVRSDDDSLGFEMMGWRALRMGRWKITWIDAPFGTSEWQLFDLAKDPGETRDLAAVHPELLQRLLQEYHAYADEVGVIYAGEGLPVSF
jgi:arylsulfatase